MSDSLPASLAASIAPAPRELTLFDVLLLLKTNSRRVAAVTVGAGALAFGITFLFAPKFTAEVVFIPPQQQQGGLMGLLAGGALGGLAGGMAGGLGLKSQGEQWQSMAKSRTVLDGLIKRFDLVKRYDQEYIFKTRKKLESRTDVSLGKDGLITIDVEDVDPKVAAQMADAYIDELNKMNDALAIASANQRKTFFEGQLKEANEALIKAESALQAGGINASLLKVSPEAAVDVVGQLKAQEAASEIKLKILATRVTPDTPEYRDAQKELEGIRAKLAEANAKSAAGAATGTGDDYVRRYRDFKYAETLFELMAKQYEMARADEAMEGTDIQVVDHAFVPEWKSSPKRGIISVIAALLAFAGSVTWLLARASLSEARAHRPSLDETLRSLRAARWFR
jgi:uncharacterized protein involved in exopolysaccharide biosynthesis